MAFHKKIGETIVCFCGKEFYRRPCEIRIRKNLFCSKPCADWFKRKPESYCLDCGKILTKRKAQYCRKHMTAGERNYQWKGGWLKNNRYLKTCGKYKQWRKNVIKENGYTCVWCGKKEDLEIDHILPWSMFPEFRFDINNGRVLCKKCHYIKTYAHSEDRTQYIGNHLKLKFGY